MEVQDEQRTTLTTENEENSATVTDKLKAETEQGSVSCQHSNK